LRPDDGVLGSYRLDPDVGPKDDQRIAADNARYRARFEKRLLAHFDQIPSFQLADQCLNFFAGVEWSNLYAPRGR